MAELHVVGSGRFGGEQIGGAGIDGDFLQIEAGENETDLAALRFDQAALRFWNPNSPKEILRLTKEGNVGIGTESPLHPLHVSQIHFGSDPFIAGLIEVTFDPQDVRAGVLTPLAALRLKALVNDANPENFRTVNGEIIDLIKTEQGGLINLRKLGSADRGCKFLTVSDVVASDVQ